MVLSLACGTLFHLCSLVVLNFFEFRSSGDQKLKSSDKRSAYLSTVDDSKASRERVPNKDNDSSEREGGRHSIDIQRRPDGLDLRNKDQEIRRFVTSAVIYTSYLVACMLACLIPCP